MAPIALGSKHQDLLKAYFEVSKTSSTPDWASIAAKADFPTPKYARDSFAIVKNKLLATGTTNLSERHMALLKATLEVMKAETDWEKVASVANFKTSKYARDSWTIVKNKLCGKSTGGTASPSKTPTKAKTPKATSSRKRKKREADDDDDDDDGASEASASADEIAIPKAKKTKKARKVKVEETEANDDAEEELARRVAEEEQAYEAGKLEPESDEQEESFFEAEMFHME